MRYLIRLVVILVLLGGIGLVAFAYVGDLRPERVPVSIPVDVDAR